MAHRVEDDASDEPESGRTPAALAPEPLVSVVVPSYNHARFICAAVDSALAQTYPRIEVVVIDDGSTDGSVALLHARYDADPRVSLHSRENQGAHATINEAIRRSRGELVAILNSDDLYEPGRIASLVAAAQAHGGLPFFGFTAVTVVDDAGAEHRDNPAFRYYDSVRRKAEGQPARASFWVGNLAMTTSNFFFSREIFEVVGGFAPLRYTHDWDWALRASERFGVTRVDVPELRYRVHGANTLSEPNPWRHLTENAFVFGTAFRRVGLSAMGASDGLSAADVLLLILANESFAPLPALLVAALGTSHEETLQLLVSGELERLARRSFDGDDVARELARTHVHLRTRLGRAWPMRAAFGLVRKGAALGSRWKARLG